MSFAVTQVAGRWSATVWCESMADGPTVPDGAMESRSCDTEPEAVAWCAANEARVVDYWLARMAWENGATVIAPEWLPHFNSWVLLGYPYGDDPHIGAKADAFLNGESDE